MYDSRNNRTWLRASIDVATHAESPRASEPGRYPFFYPLLAGLLDAVAFQLPEPVSQQDHHHAVMEVTPRTALEVIQAQLFLQLLVPLFHPPAALPRTHCRLVAGACRQVRYCELQRPVVVFLDQQPHGYGLGTCALCPTVHAHTPTKVNRPDRFSLVPSRHVTWRRGSRAATALMGTTGRGVLGAGRDRVRRRPRVAFAGRAHSDSSVSTPSSLVTPTWYLSPGASSLSRNAPKTPYPASAITARPGKPSARTRSSNSKAILGLVRERRWSLGTPPCLVA